MWSSSLPDPAPTSTDCVRKGCAELANIEGPPAIRDRPTDVARRPPGRRRLLVPGHGKNSPPETLILLESGSRDTITLPAAAEGVRARPGRKQGPKESLEIA